MTSDQTETPALPAIRQSEDSGLRLWSGDMMTGSVQQEVMQVRRG